MLNDYIIEKKLGEGSYGVVYKVKKKNNNNNYVLKQISLKGLTDNKKNEFKLEAEILSKINSKYVVKYEKSFEEDNTFNIIMEYCENGDLSDYIGNQKKKGKPLDENIIWTFFIKIALGLADIHKMNILHRDLKSLNVFLKKDNDIRVGDLGIAKLLNETFFAKTFIGTPYYLSPEICEDKPYNNKSDVWALGCIIYELCTYSYPFIANSQPALLQKILYDKPKPIQNYSKQLTNLITKMFNKNYRKRPSCLDILTDPYVINKAKELKLLEDIQKSFPTIKIKKDIKKNEKNDIRADKKYEPKNLIKDDKKIINKSNKSNNNNNNNYQKIKVVPKVDKPKQSVDHISKINPKKDNGIEKLVLLPCTERRRRRVDNSNTKEQISSNSELKDTLGQNLANNNDNSNNNIIKDINKDDNLNIINNNLNNERFINMMDNEKDKKFHYNKNKEEDKEIKKDNNTDTLKGLISDFDNEDNNNINNLENNDNNNMNGLTEETEIEFSKEEEKEDLIDEINILKAKINSLKEDLPKLIGEDKYQYIMNIFSNGIKDDSKKEEVNEQIDKFIKENSVDNNNSFNQNLYNIYSLFILECQLNKKEKELNNI